METITEPGQPVHKDIDIEGASYGYVERKLMEHNRALLFTNAGAMRLALIAGWIQGIHDSGGAREAAFFTQSLSEALTRVCPSQEKGGTFWGGPHYVRRCVLSDDGTRHGFSLLWYNLCDKEQLIKLYGTESYKWKEKNPRIRMFVDCRNWAEDTSGTAWDAPYIASYNGGLLWHGAGDNSFACNLSSGTNPWSIHT